MKCILLLLSVGLQRVSSRQKAVDVATNLLEPVLLLQLAGWN